MLACTDLRIASNVMDIDAQEMAQTVRHKHGTHVSLDHVLHVALQKADVHKFLQVNAVGQAVHIRPVDPCMITKRTIVIIAPRRALHFLYR